MRSNLVSTAVAAVAALALFGFAPQTAVGSYFAADQRVAQADGFGWE